MDSNLNRISKPITQEMREHIEALPGVERVESNLRLGTFSSENFASVSLSFEGIEERTIDFFVIEYDAWKESFCLSAAEAEAFENGEIVLLCIPWDNESAILPQGDILLRAVNEQGDIVSALSATPLVWRIPRNFSGRGRLAIREQTYAVGCSEAYLKKLLAAMQSGTTWDCYEAGGEFCYQTLLVTAAESADINSVSGAVKAYCVKERLTFFDYMERTREHLQSITQSLILLYACGGCIALVTLLLLASALALEAEQERRSYTILRVIGMSLRQMRKKVFGKALWRSVFAIVVGWALYSVLCIRTQLALNEYTLAEAAERAWSSFTYYGGGPTFIAALSAAMLAVLLGVSLLSKRGLKESTRLK